LLNDPETVVPNVDMLVVIHSVHESHKAKKIIGTNTLASFPPMAMQRWGKNIL
jgi:hypothetical protein